MARVCHACKFYTEDGDASVCPTCSGKLQFTLLPPPGRAAAPLPGVPEPSFNRAATAEKERAQIGEMLRWVMRQRKVALAVLAPVLMVLGAVFGFGRDSLKDKYNRIQVGMTQEEVRQVLKQGAGPAASAILDMPLVTTGPADVSWEEAGATINIHFVNGRVTSKSQKGLN
jgi:hypothetical protein